MLRPAASFAVAAFLACLAAEPASACRGPMFEQSLFFDAVPAGIDAGAIANVFVMAVVPDGHRQVAVAYVRQTIRGSFDQWWPVYVVSVPTSCGPYVRAGDRGILAGELRRGAYGMLELIPVTETRGQRDARKSPMQERRS